MSVGMDCTKAAEHESNAGQPVSLAFCKLRFFFFFITLKPGVSLAFFICMFIIFFYFFFLFFVTLKPRVE